MFWSGKTSWFVQLEAFLLKRELQTLHRSIQNPEGSIYPVVAETRDAPGIAKLLNNHFESNALSCTAVTVEWILGTFIKGVTWVIIKDYRGTIRGCISSFPCPSPYPSQHTEWGIVDWYCVHPLWRSKGLGSSLLAMLDHVMYKKGRQPHIFLKEGVPLSYPHIPIYTTVLRCRRAGNPAVYVMPDRKGIYPYMTNEKATGLPLVRVDPCSDKSEKEWEACLDTLLPPCIVFVSSGIVDARWKIDSLVSMYAFHWVAGKWFGSVPNSMIV